jgi:hypothetical protein
LQIQNKVIHLLHQTVKHLAMRTNLTRMHATKTSLFYKDVFAQCQRIYKNIASIEKAYIKKGEIFAINYTTTTGEIILAPNTEGKEKIVNFK